MRAWTVRNDTGRVSRSQIGTKKEGWSIRLDSVAYFDVIDESSSLGSRPNGLLCQLLVIEAPHISAQFNGVGILVNTNSSKLANRALGQHIARLMGAFLSFHLYHDSNSIAVGFVDKARKRNGCLTLSDSSSFELASPFQAFDRASRIGGLDWLLAKPCYSPASGNRLSCR